MSFLARIFGKSSAAPDPTSQWDQANSVGLVVAPHEGRFGQLKFGDPIAAARHLGRPSRFRWTQNDYCELLYSHAGFQIDFDAGRFAYAAFFMDRHVAEPDLEGGYHLAVVSLKRPDGHMDDLSKTSTRTTIECHLGAPNRVDPDHDEIILTYQIGLHTLEFEVHPLNGTLMRMNLYPSTQE